MGRSLGTGHFNPDDKTFTELRSGKYPWWDNLKKNGKISIQIRKGNTLDVYYNGGAMFGELRYDDRQGVFTARIHPKYIPLEDESRYQSLALGAGGVKFTGKIGISALSQFEDAKLKAVMNRIAQYFGSETEKAIQYSFAVKDPYIIDTEFQWENDLRIDLIRLDAKAKRIVLVEVKTMGDPRLFGDSKKGNENIHDQLKIYREFARDHSREILDYYIKVLQVKNDLGLTKPELKKLNLEGWQVEPRPLLAFGDCEQAWIDRVSDIIDQKIKDVAYGAYYFGKPEYSLDLAAKSQKNRHVF
jgi:hypothetical protein